MKGTNAKRKLQEQREKFYRDIREALLCSCGRPAIGLNDDPRKFFASSLLVCAEHNTFPTKRKYYLPPTPDFDEKNPVFNLDKWLENSKLTHV